MTAKAQKASHQIAWVFDPVPGHLRYWPLRWQPVPIDRAIRIDIEKAKSLP